jgi:hypothetical protein
MKNYTHILSMLMRFVNETETSSRRFHALQHQASTRCSTSITHYAKIKREREQRDISR